MRIFRVFLIIFAVLSFAQSTTAAERDVVDGITIEGISLKSTSDQIQKVIDRLKVDAWKCQESKLEQREDTRGNSLVVMPKDYRWDCMYQKPEAPADWQKLEVKFIHDRIIYLHFSGARLPDLGKAGLVETLRAAHTKLSKLSNLPDDYKYKDYEDIPGASSQVFQQELNARFPKTCKAAIGHEASYKYGLHGSYMFIPKQESKTVNITLINDHQNNCYRYLSKTPR